MHFLGFVVDVNRWGSFEELKNSLNVVSLVSAPYSHHCPSGPGQVRRGAVGCCWPQRVCCCCAHCTGIRSAQHHRSRTHHFNTLILRPVPLTAWTISIHHYLLWFRINGLESSRINISCSLISFWRCELLYY